MSETTGTSDNMEMDHGSLCRRCGGATDGCVCGDPVQPPGRREDIETMAACAESGVACVAVATLVGDEPREVVVTRTSDLEVHDSTGRRNCIDPEEVLPPDYETEVRQAYALDLSPEDGHLREALESAGWRVTTARIRRRNDILEELVRLDAAAAACGDKCVSVAKIVDEAGYPIADTVIAESPDGTIRLLDEDMGHGTLPPDGLTVSLPSGSNRFAEGLDAAGYVVLGYARAAEVLTLTYTECAAPTHRAFAKVLTATDSGRNGTNQGGPCIPSAVRGVLPYPLPRGDWPTAAVEVTLDIIGFGGAIRRTVPARVLSHTRGLKRPIETHLTSFMSHVEVKAGDIMVVERTGDARYSVTFLSDGSESHAVWLGRLGGRRFDIVE